MPVSIVTNEDNMAMMSRYPDKYFDLAIVDPPYGIDMGNYNRTVKDKVGKRHKAKEWDANIPLDSYFNELYRVSKNQIIWGGNYFPQLWLNGCKGFIFWNKKQPVQTFADGEMAWTSFDMPARCFTYAYYGNLSGNTTAPTKIHTTQKPVELYKWLLKNYAKSNDKILDTHLGSGSSRIAAYDLGFDFYGCELDKDYFDAQEKRFADHVSKIDFWQPEKEVIKVEPINLM